MAQALRSTNDNLPRGIEVALEQVRGDPEAWTVEVIDAGSEGEIYQALFTGPRAKERAAAYALIAYGVPSDFSRISTST